MRTPTDYIPGPPPSDPQQLQRYLTEEFQKLSAAIGRVAEGHLEKSAVEPAKRRDGDIRYADGVNWQPNGAGAVGIWYFNGTAWVQLG